MISSIILPVTVTCPPEVECTGGPGGEGEAAYTGGPGGEVEAAWSPGSDDTQDQGRNQPRAAV